MGKTYKDRMGNELEPGFYTFGRSLRVVYISKAGSNGEEKWIIESRTGMPEVLELATEARLFVPVEDPRECARQLDSLHEDTLEGR